ncbi:hypothetical protein AYI69_g418 [Smittium culicis]|uniref:Uncharacterized protein n=1 Tax=Smittium culicis TaxID=133412 RepID=A0A1R1YT35_9FUNG|nr:hypothetical protein AYI69_g418 [Smittium culicis]
MEFSISTRAGFDNPLSRLLKCSTLGIPNRGYKFVKFIGCSISGFNNTGYHGCESQFGVTMTILSYFKIALCKTGSIVRGGENAYATDFVQE